MDWTRSLAPHSRDLDPNDLFILGHPKSHGYAKPMKIEGSCYADSRRCGSMHDMFQCFRRDVEPASGFLNFQPPNVAGDPMFY
ncbi:hypothetical protein NPIL_252711, partial [Nephila pilipes]